MLVSAALAPVTTMHCLLAPILAQLLTLGSGARTEVRYVAESTELPNDQRQFDDHFEGGLGAGVGLTLNLEPLVLYAGYGPSLTIEPLESSPRDARIDHTAFANASIGHSFRIKRTTVGVSQSVDYSMRNSSVLAVAGQTALPLPPGSTGETPPGERPPEEVPPGETPPGGGSLAPPGLDPADVGATDRGTSGETLHTGALRTELGFSHRLSRKTTLDEEFGYTFSMGLGRYSRRAYPFTHGPEAGIALTYRMDARNSFRTDLRGTYNWSETGAEGLIVGLAESWTHDFSRRTRGEASIGVAYTRTVYLDEPVPNSIYPTARLGFSHTARVARGMLTAGASIGSAPVLDFTTALVDPRVGILGFVGWVRDRTTLGAAVDSAISIPGMGGEQAGALNTINASASVTYNLGVGFSADAGVRASWLEYDDFDSIPPSLTFYVGLGWSGGVTLIQGPPRRARAY